ncbi:SRPBCC family protein [Nonomuraea sp. NPDC050394]|uniref:SRPBCC family protein n=1 Tax=Nonomuraea sp. NPDC050394 TaxID=3364363 RepID=UPI0037945BF0
MKRAFTVDAVIDRPARDVWRVLTDWERAPRWMQGVESMYAESGTRVGSTIIFHARGKTRTSEIADLDEGRSITLVTIQGGVTARYVYRLEPLDGDARTRARLTADLATTGFPWTLLAPLIRLAVRRTDAGQIHALRTAAENAQA